MEQPVNVGDTVSLLVRGMSRRLGRQP